MKLGSIFAELCLLVFFLYRGFNANDSAATIFFALAGLMAILIIGTFFGFNKK